jgi:putative SOS response-associated peptidase YedK
MCYRYTLKSLEALVSYCEEIADSAAGEWTPRYNVALTSRMPVIAQRVRPTLEAMNFGFTLPARTPAGRPLLLGNARAETLLAKPAFRDAAMHRRCLVPADGFYEWEKTGTARLPHYFTMKDQRPFFFAGLWAPERDSLPPAFCIVTTAPNTLLRAIHDRMPVMLEGETARVWLGGTPLEPIQLATLCQSFPADQMSGHRVDPRVNNVRYEAPDCVVPV